MPHTPHLIYLTLVGLVAPTGVAQPLPERVEIPELSQEYHLYPALGMHIWRVPAPHELSWVIAYDETPLDVDWPKFEIRLINEGRDLHTPPDATDPTVSVVCELDRPDGTTITSEPLLEPCFVYPSIEKPIKADFPVLRVAARLHHIFGDLQPGVHTLTIHIDSAAALQSDSDTISERFVISTPKLRFNVMKARIPEPGDEPGFGTMQRGEYGLWHTTLTNTYETPITLEVDIDQPGQTHQPDSDERYTLDNIIQRLNETGWAYHGRPRIHRTEMRTLTLDPGQSIDIALQTFGQLDGINRAAVEATLQDGTKVFFCSPPLRNHETHVNDLP